MTARIAGNHNLFDFPDAIFLKLPALLMLLQAAAVSAATGSTQADAQHQPPPALILEVFVRDGCPHCAAVKEFLPDFQ